MKTLRINLCTTSLTVFTLAVAPTLTARGAHSPAPQSAPAAPAPEKQQPKAPPKEGAAAPTAAAPASPARPLRIATKDVRDHTAEKLTGHRVRGRDGNTLGKIKDFLIDTESGQVAFVVVSSGGAFGIGNELRLVPFTAARQTGSETKYNVDLDEAAWRQLATVEEKDLKAGAITISDGQRRRIAQAFSHAKPAPDDAFYTAGISQHLVRASALDGTKVRTGHGGAGEIDGIVIDAGSRQASAVFDPRREFLSTHQKFLVPIEELSISGTEHPHVVMALTADDFRATQTGKHPVPAGSAASPQVAAKKPAEQKSSATPAPTQVAATEKNPAQEPASHEQNSSAVAKAAPTEPMKKQSAATGAPVTSTPESQDIATATNAKKSGASSNSNVPATSSPSAQVADADNRQKEKSATEPATNGAKDKSQQQVVAASTSPSSVREDQPDTADKETSKMVPPTNSAAGTLKPGDKSAIAAAGKPVRSAGATAAPPTLTPTGKTSADQTPAGSSALVAAAREIRRALDNDPKLARADVRITPENGKLVLRGTVEDDAQKQAVEQLARKAAPGQELEDELTMKAK